MNVFIFDPLQTHCWSAIGALLKYRGIKQVITTRTLLDFTRGGIPKVDLHYDAALFRIPSVVSQGGQDIHARSRKAEKTLRVVVATMRSRIPCMVCPNPCPLWFYEIQTDQPADENVFFRRVDPNTNVFTGCYRAPNWRVLFDTLLT